MCGICGFVGYGDKILLKKMCSAMAHRGPDQSGVFADSNVGLGSRRLSIIGVKGGRQPIRNEDGSVWVVFNGEIYNFVSLREMLEKRGHKFYTNTDTETIVHLYEEFGERCLAHLKGMFAFAVWDGKQLFAARDRFGKKPFYYTLHYCALFFSSLIK